MALKYLYFHLLNSALNVFLITSSVFFLKRVYGFCSLQHTQTRNVFGAYIIDSYTSQGKDVVCKHQTGENYMLLK
jgi:hypothetical protein